MVFILFSSCSIVVAYPDQPYCVTSDKAWTCIITVGPNGEGGANEHMVSMVSTDLGTARRERKKKEDEEKKKKREKKTMKMKENNKKKKRY